MSEILILFKKKVYAWCNELLVFILWYKIGPILDHFAVSFFQAQISYFWRVEKVWKMQKLQRFLSVLWLLHWLILLLLFMLRIVVLFSFLNFVCLFTFKSELFWSYSIWKVRMNAIRLKITIYGPWFIVLIYFLFMFMVK